jgi:lipopolysaccharide/colanic/teichoic acid biosynthesis glycosyltransferase
MAAIHDVQSWQSLGSREPSFEKNVVLVLKYVENWSVWLDPKILVKTI